MSEHSWIEEFYPVEASAVKAGDALEHSIKKWEGTSPENLMKHNVVMKDGAIEEYDGTVVHDFWTGTCALCAQYYFAGCDNCPIKPCRDDFAELTRNNDPEPMLKVLYKARMQKKGVSGND